MTAVFFLPNTLLPPSPHHESGLARLWKHVRAQVKRVVERILSRWFDKGASDSRASNVPIPASEEHIPASDGAASPQIAVSDVPKG